MIFEADPANKTLNLFTSNWKIKELELERYLMSTADEEAPMLNSSVFGEPLLLIDRQVRTKRSKRADILALDRMGNSVIIELKRNMGTLGVEVQALQYLADFAKYKGQSFIDRFTGNDSTIKEDILGFIGDDLQIEDVNKNSRIILIAQSFDPTLFSMGEWLSNKGVAFRCIEYKPIEYHDKHFLSFSIAFDRCPDTIFPLSFESSIRQPGYYWHNIGKSNNQWWGFLVSNGQIATSFDNQPGDQGEKILKGYIKGDTVIAYAKKYGAIGFGIIKDPASYKLIKPASNGDHLGGELLHRLNIEWKYTVKDLKNAIPPVILLEKYGIYHPRATSAKINANKAKLLISKMQNMLNNSG